MSGNVKAQLLLKHLKSVQNKSGSIKPSPMTLLKLKESLKKVPLELLQKSMSGVVTSQNLMKGIQMAAKQLGGLSNVGEFKNILSQAQAGGSSGAGLNDQSAQEIAARVSLPDLEEAVNPSMALGLSLTAGYLSREEQVELDQETPAALTTTETA